MKKIPKRKYSGIVPAILFILLGCSPFQTLSAQDESYKIIPAPDVWYNDVDGIRLGVRVLGEMEGTYLDGPHRLEAGVWLGTWIPDRPLSYYLSFTEPIPAISSFGSEGNLQLESSVRTGFSKHGLYFNKRWQFGFDEFKYLEFSSGISTEKMFDEEYRQYPEHWTFGVRSLPFAVRRDLNEQIHLLNLGVLMHQRHGLGPYSVDLNLRHQLNSDMLPGFTRFDTEIQQQIPIGLGFTLSLRSFIGLANEAVPYQYSYLSGVKSMIDWLDHGLTRAKGTIPMSILDEGNIQFTGGANLRGYTHMDMGALATASFLRDIQYSDDYLLTSVASLNVELDYPNPLHKKLKSIPILGDFLAMRSYVFYDVGTMPKHRGGALFETSKSDAGAGFEFSINIPDYLGKDRGLFIRYDLPLWLSHPVGNTNFKFRHLIGIGANISL